MKYKNYTRFLKKTTLMLASIILINKSTAASILYTDIDPDKSLENDFLEIDLNGDGTIDISIDNWSDFTNGQAYAEITFSHANIEIVGIPIPNRTDDGSSSPHDLYASINSSLNYINSSSVTNSNAAIAFKGDGGEDYTPWIWLLNKYVGFRFKKNNQYHYGWIELSFSSNFELTVHGYAYEDVANTPIQTGDTGGSSNSAPTDISLSSNIIDENQTANATIATFSTTDVDTNDSHTYSLITGNGDNDNGSFSIENNALKAITIFDYERQSTYSIRVKTDDGNGGTFEKQFTITINDVNDPPTFLILVNLEGEVDNSIDEGEAVGSIVAYIGVSDDDENDVHSFTLVDGDGSDDNDQFTIESFALKSNAVFDYETKSSYTIRVKADDGNGGTYEQKLDININDIHNASSDIIANQATQIFPNPANSLLHIKGIQPNSTLQLVSSMGIVIFEEKNKSSYEMINISELPSGAYWLYISNTNNTITTRMITIE